MKPKAYLFACLFCLLYTTAKAQTNKNNLIDSVQLYIDLGNSLKGQEAVLNYQKAIDKLPAKDTVYLALLKKIGQAYRKEKRYQEALPYYHEVDAIVSQSNDTIGMIKAQSRIASLYKKTGEEDSCTAYYQTVIALSENHESKYLLFSLYNNFASSLDYFGHYREAINMYGKAQEIAIQEQDSLNIAKTHRNIGLAYDKLGEASKGLAHYYKAVELLARHPKKSLEAACFNSIGNSNEQLGNLKDALHYHFKAQSIYRAIENWGYVARSYGNIGNVYHDLHKSDSSLFFFRKALLYADKANYRRKYIALYGIGKVYNTRQEADSAIYYYTNSYQLAKADSNKESTAYAASALGEVMVGLGQLDKAKAYLDEAWSIGQEIDHPKIQQKTLLGKIAFYKEQEDMEAATLSYESYLKIKEKLDVSKDKALRMTYEYKLNEREATQLNLFENKLAVIETKNTMQLGGAGAVSLVFMVASGFIYRQKQAKQRHNEELRQKKEEVEEANEKLKSSYEEITLLNEVLHQRNEEVEDTNKKLQSSNEEISRLNGVLKEKNAIIMSQNTEIRHQVGSHLTRVNNLLHDFRSHTNSQDVARELGKLGSMTIALTSLQDHLFNPHDDDGHTSIRAVSYFRELKAQLFNTHHIDKKVVRLDISISPDIYLSGKHLTPLAMIASELMSNALKYAVPTVAKPHIQVALKPIENDYFELIVSDNGAVLPQTKASKGTGKGLNIIGKLVEELKGSIETIQEEGTTHKITIPCK